MDTAWIVASTSIATVFVTGAITLLGKWLDSNQKLNEHKLSIRAAYVNKKIEAGIDFVSKATIRINGHYLVSVFYKYLYERKAFNNEYWEAINAAKMKQREINASSTNSPHLFFDILHLNDRANELIHEMNSQQSILSDYLKSGGAIEYVTEIDLAAKKYYELNERLIKIYQEMNISVREELAKYDVI